MTLIGPIASLELAEYLRIAQASRPDPENIVNRFLAALTSGELESG
jgi:hypothetical protein